MIRPVALSTLPVPILQRFAVVLIALAMAPAAGCKPAADQASLSGRVVKVYDGDTVLMQVQGRRIRVRLAEIDTPEFGQPHGEEAERALAALVLRREVRAEVQDVDDYGRVVARLYRDGLDVNATLVGDGHAWVFHRYARDPKLEALEEQARLARRGLWALPGQARVAPWDWRQAQSKPRPPRAKAQRRFSCGSVSECRQMRSCGEALYQLYVCRLPNIDGDGDGVPCEALCR